ncbi:cell division protein ZapA [Novosphingobium lentum]|uniref:cell division protein ZapA n=1 Tax=Novosphingobium lentum TaxID=145287 RepID=UPI0008348E53|nr:cell division protein ZapA [Novosphingobium lentum]
MSNVNLSIGGRIFAVASAPGEEEHIAMLGRLVDDRLRDMGGAGQQSESRMLLFATLLLADELHELKARNGAGEADVPAASSAISSFSAAPDALQVAARVEALAARVEKLAAHLEPGATSA